MLKLSAFLALLCLSTSTFAADSLRLLLDKGHSEALVQYLESAGVEIKRADPFAVVEKSPAVVDRLNEFARKQDEIIQSAQASFRSQGDAFSALQAAKIRRSLATRALESCQPEVASLD